MSAASEQNSKTTIFEIYEQDRYKCLAQSLPEVFERLGHILFRNEFPGMEPRKMMEFPELDAVGLSGSWPHRVRFEVEQAGRRVWITEHDLSAPVDGLTETDVITLHADFDASYEIQKHLYFVSLGIETAEKASEALNHEIKRSLQRALHKYSRVKCRETEDVIKDIERTHARMGGPNLLPETVEDADELFNAFPRICVERFQELAELAFPQPSMKL